MLNFFIAMFWLVLGLGLLLLPGINHFQILDTGISLGWIAIGLSGYNGLRWLLWRSQQRRRREPVSEPQPSAPKEYLPEFDFGKDNPEAK